MIEGQGSVLVVDDDLDVCEAYAEVLGEAGYEVAIVHNGREALTHLERAARTPDVILIDLMMPIMDGWQLRRELAERPALKGVPVVVMSAGRKVPEVPAAGHLQKPVSLEALLDEVARFCGGERRT